MCMLGLLSLVLCLVRLPLVCGSSAGAGPLAAAQGAPLSNQLGAAFAQLMHSPVVANAPRLQLLGVDVAVSLLVSLILGFLESATQFCLEGVPAGSPGDMQRLPGNMLLAFMSATAYLDAVVLLSRLANRTGRAGLRRAQIALSGAQLLGKAGSLGVLAFLALAALCAGPSLYSSLFSFSQVSMVLAVMAFVAEIASQY